jgi:hypothetical protein
MATNPRIVTRLRIVVLLQSMVVVILVELTPAISISAESKVKVNRVDCFSYCK